MATRDEQLAVVEQFFEGGPEVDRLSLLTDDVEWWNGLGRFPGAPGQTVFRGRQEVGDVVLGRTPGPRTVHGRTVDRYDLGLFPIAHTIGTDLRPTPRRPATDITTWNTF